MRFVTGNSLAFVGVNGYGVYTDTKTALKAKPFVKEYQARFFKTPVGAIKWVSNKYDQLQGPDKGRYQIEEIQKVNWFYHRH